ncbi:MAG: hypothetical protein SFX74_05440 [Fimbriimonadaceae bacterium]|nr:hypothetical protein [Fimbriimonadaceae bacterium]
MNLSKKFVFVGALASVVLLAGCQSGTAEPYLNATIAGHYQDFYTNGPTDPDAAMRALDAAEQADRKNAYTLYLRATAEAGAKKYAEALQTMQAAHALPNVTHYVATPPPDDDMATLGRIRQLGYTTRDAKALGDDAAMYCRNVRKVGARVAKAQPITSLGALAGIAVIRNSYENELKLKLSPEAEQSLKAERAKFDAWTTTFNDGLKSTLKNMMQEAGKAAGLTDAELVQYAKGERLANAEKQRKADEARAKLYDAEVAEITRLLETMPEIR